MLKTIIYREFLANIITFRFLLGLIICMALVGANTYVLTRSYEAKLQSYQLAVQAHTDEIRNIEVYSDLSCRHLPKADKKPRLMSILNEGLEGRLGNTVEVSYNRVPVKAKQHGSDNPYLVVFRRIDLTLVFQIVISLLALLFSYDAIAGARESGTLPLTLSNAVSRGTLLLGKYLGGMLSLILPLTVSLMVGVLVILLSRYTAISASDWARIGLMAAVSFVYVSLFIGRGLAVSGRMARSSTSLLVLLLIWVVLVVLVPNTLGSVVSTLRRVPSQREFGEQREAAILEVHDSMKDRFKYGSPTQPDPDVKAIKLWADFVTNLFDTGSRLDDEHLDAQFAQVQLARRILRSASPTTIYNYTMESLAGTGFERHRQFVEAVHRHRERFIDFIKATDRSDSKSFHIYYLKEGLSDKPVSSDNVPRFAEAAGVSAAIRNTFTHIGVLVVLSVLLFLISYISFLRCDVR